MSIIIKGLNLPKEELNQERLTITIWANGCVTNDGDWVRNEDGTYRKEYWNYEQFSAVELPPHGRLIDADELRGWYDYHSYDVDEDDFLTEEKFDKLTVTTAVVRQNIDDAPTIIEADDSIKQGEWEKHNDGIMYWWECSKCHHDAWYDEDDLHNYCPWCGAKMTIIESEEEET